MTMRTAVLLLVLSSAPAARPGDDSPRPAPAAGAVSIRLTKDLDFEVVGLDRDALTRIGRNAKHLDDLFRVSVDGGPGSAERPAMLGAYAITGGALRFVPRFPPEPGLTYRAVFDPKGVVKDLRAISARFSIPKAPIGARPRVARVDPTADRVPENLLKLYVHFTEPMARGDVYRHLRLLGPDGKAVDMPFLELEQELWDARGTRLTLILDPGRVKQGLVPREEEGPILEAGKSYTLVVGRSLVDARGNALGEDFRKTFRAGPPDTSPPDPKRWTLKAPKAGSTDPLTLDFDEPLDRSMLDRVLSVVDGKGRRVAGRVEVPDTARNWRFRPESAWESGDYRVAVQTILEDLAGNTIGRPFEIDLFDKIEATKRAGEDTVSIPFRVE